MMKLLLKSINGLYNKFVLKKIKYNIKVYLSMAE